MMVLLISIILVLLALNGAPLFSVIAAAALFGFYIADINLQVIAIELYRLAETPLLVALPLFTLTGYLLSESGTSKRILNVMQASIGWMPGGLVIFSLIICAMFTAFTGAAGITIVALGALLYPAIKKAGYSDDFSLGLITSSGSLGLLLAPSLPLILYGIIVQQMDLDTSFTLNELFIAGVLPTILMIICIAIYSVYKQNQTNIEIVKFDKQALLSAIIKMKWELPLPIVIVTGIYSGLFVISEAAAITVLYVFIVEVLIYKEIKFQKLQDIVIASMSMAGAILIILAVSLALTNVIIDAEIPDRLFNFISNSIESKYTFLLLLNIFLLFIGAILDIFSALVIIVPLIVPVAMSFGVHPVHLGIIFLANMQIGYMTPPVGLNLFISSTRFNRPIADVYRTSMPFMLILLLVLIAVTYLPVLSLAFIN